MHNTTEKEILMSLVRLETKVDQLGNVREIAMEAQQSSKSAHLRLDRLDDLKLDRIEIIKSQQEKVDKIIFWAGTTLIGGFILGAISLLFYFAKQ